MTALRSDTDATLSLGGRFKFGIDQWAYLPFDVPAGVSRIEVSTSHEQFSLLGIGRNVLDLGIFGPAGHQLQAQRRRPRVQERAHGNAGTVPRLPAALVPPTVLLGSNFFVGYSLVRLLDS